MGHGRRGPGGDAEQTLPPTLPCSAPGWDRPRGQGSGEGAPWGGPGPHAVTSVLGRPLPANWPTQCRVHSLPLESLLWNDLGWAETSQWPEAQRSLAQRKGCHPGGCWTRGPGHAGTARR